MLRKILFLILLLCGTANAATYYVSTTGDDGDTGGVGDPWRTIKYAVDQLSAGDTLNILAGTYYESEIILSQDGALGNVITIQGEVDADGKPTTIINSSEVDTTGQWVHDPTLDDATDNSVKIYKNTTLGYKPQAMLTGDKTIPEIGDSFFPDSAVWCFTENTVTGMEMLQFKRDKTITVDYGTYRFWDGIWALYGWDSTTSTVYLRFRNGEDPNTMNIRVPLYSDYYCLNARNMDYVTIKNLKLMGCDRGFITQNVIDQPSNISLDNLEIIFSTSWGIHTYDIDTFSVTNSLVYMDLYGDNLFGVWNYADTSTYGYNLENNRYAYNWFKYNLFKCIVEDGSRESSGIHIGAGTTNYIVSGNTIRDGRVALWADEADNGDIYNNLIYNQSSVGFIPYRYSHNVKFRDNTLWNNNINIRVHHFNPSEQDREIYIYRNRCWNPRGVGNQITYHYSTDATPLVTPGTVVFEHNIFVGGRMGNSFNNASIASGGMPNVRYRYNVFASQQATYVTAAFYTTAGMMETFDCNAVYNNWHVSAPADPEDPVTGIPWWGDNNMPEDGGGAFAPNTFDPLFFPWYVTTNPTWHIPPGTFHEDCLVPMAQAEDSY